MVSSAPHFKLVLLISYPHYLLDRLLAVGETRIKFLLLRTEERYNSFRDWTNDPMTNSRKISFQGIFFFIDFTKFWWFPFLKWVNGKISWNWFGTKRHYNKNKITKKCVSRDYFDTQTRGKLVFDETWETCFHEKKPKLQIFLIFFFLQVKKEIICQIDFKREQGLWAVEPKTPRL